MVNRQPLSEDASCLVENKTAIDSPTLGSTCRPVWDGVLCWPRTDAGETVRRSCPNLESSPEGVYAYRICLENASWKWDNWTNYNKCMSYIKTSNDDILTHYRIILRYIYLYGSIVNIVVLILVILIYLNFKSLHCPRITIHMHLAYSYLFRSCFFFVKILSITSWKHLRHEYPWTCKAITVINIYTLVATFFWAFNEGFFIVRIVIIDVFSNSNTLWSYHLIGWGLPFLVTLTWLITMSLVDTSDMNDCWDGYAQMGIAWIFEGPMLATILLNIVAMGTIIALLVTKLRAQNATERQQLGKAIKSMLILMPLLGITYILFPFHFKGAHHEAAFRIFNAVNHNIQGIAVGILYCFMNKQVRVLMKRRAETLLNGWRLGKERRRRSCNWKEKDFKDCQLCRVQTEKRQKPPGEEFEMSSFSETIHPRCPHSAPVKSINPNTVTTSFRKSSLPQLRNLLTGRRTSQNTGNLDKIQEKNQALPGGANYQPVDNMLNPNINEQQQLQNLLLSRGQHMAALEKITTRNTTRNHLTVPPVDTNYQPVNKHMLNTSSTMQSMINDRDTSSVSLKLMPNNQQQEQHQEDQIQDQQHHEQQHHEQQHHEQQSQEQKHQEQQQLPLL